MPLTRKAVTFVFCQTARSSRRTTAIFLSNRIGSTRADLEEDAPGRLGRTAVDEEVDRLVEVDVTAARELRCEPVRIPRTLQLLGTPALDALVLGLDDGYL